MSLPRESHTFRVLDRGYVRLVNVMGGDLTVVNAARVSYDKESAELTEKDVRLIKFLAAHGHTSPFRHATLQWEIYAPLMVARQWWRYIVGSLHQDPLGAWNESSRRYVTEEPEFYVPVEWRSAPEHRKQGSGAPVHPKLAKKLTTWLLDVIDLGTTCYEEALKAGVAVEQARLFLPAYGLYVRWYWTCSLQALAHFLEQRLDEHAQWEIRQYAKAVARLALPYFEVSLGELLRDNPAIAEGVDI